MSSLTDGMTLEQQVGQLLMVGFTGTTATPEALDLIQSGHVGGVILFSRNIETPEQTLALTTSLQAAARAAGHPFPLLIAIDQENGIIRRTGPGTTTFPGSMALGAIGDASLAEAVARATGEELRALGITQNLAPVVDVANNSANPVIGVRSFGADAELVARLGAATVRGLQAAGVAATLKHFPGHGDTATDTHLALAEIPHGIERLEAIELPPFRAGIAAGADVVMTAHVALPAYTGSATLPATLSSEVIQGLLRQRLGYQGVVMTDCLEMNAISKGVGIARGAAQALRAGADIVLVSHRYDRQIEALTAIRQSVGDGSLSAELVSEAVVRVLRLKQGLPSWDDLPGEATLSSLATEAHRQLADDAYARSMTLIRDDAGILPLSWDSVSDILVVWQHGAHISQAADRAFHPNIFVESLRQRLGAREDVVQFVTLPAAPGESDTAALREHASQAQTVILLTCNAHQASHIASSRAIVSALVEAGRPVIGVAVCNPYDAAALPAVGTWLATYDFLAPALDAAAGALVGAIPAQGRLPVSL